jgi:hypothetical protein
MIGYLNNYKKKVSFYGEVIGRWENTEFCRSEKKHHSTNKMIHLHNNNKKNPSFPRVEDKINQPNLIGLHFIIHIKQSVSLILIKDIFVFTIQLYFLI